MGWTTPSVHPAQPCTLSQHTAGKQAGDSRYYVPATFLERDLVRDVLDQIAVGHATDHDRRHCLAVYLLRLCGTDAHECDV